jgi:hypothetical protein
MTYIVAFLAFWGTFYHVVIILNSNPRANGAEKQLYT